MREPVVPKPMSALIAAIEKTTRAIDAVWDEKTWSTRQRRLLNELGDADSAQHDIYLDRHEALFYTVQFLLTCRSEVVGDAVKWFDADGEVEPPDYVAFCLAESRESQARALAAAKKEIN